MFVHSAGNYDNLALSPQEEQYSADEADLPSPSYDGSESLEMYSSVDDSLLYTDVQPSTDRDQLIRPSQLRQRRSMYAGTYHACTMATECRQGLFIVFPCSCLSDYV